MFKKIRLIINKETRVSRFTEVFKWMLFILFFDALFVFITVSIFDQGIISRPKLILSFILVLFLINVILIRNFKKINAYLYATHPYTIKKKELNIMVSKQKEEAIKKQKHLNEEAIKKQKKLDEETAKILAMQEERERKKREEKKRLDRLIEDALSKENAHESLKNFLIEKKSHYNNLDNQGKKEWLEVRAKELKDEEEALDNSPLTNYFGAVEGGETILYYLKLENKFGETRYKIGVTLNCVEKRYAGKSGYKILYEKKLTHANTIEKKILEKFNHLVTDESLLGTNGTEIFKEDVLKLDI